MLHSRNIQITIDYVCIKGRDLHFSLTAFYYKDWNMQKTLQNCHEGNGIQFTFMLFLMPYINIKKICCKSFSYYSNESFNKTYCLPKLYIYNRNTRNTTDR